MPPLNSVTGVPDDGSRAACFDGAPVELGGEVGDLLIHHTADVKTGVEIGGALVVPKQNVLQQRPFLFRLIIRDERTGIEEQEKNAFLGGIDQLARIVEILRIAGRRKPLCNTPAVDIEGFGL